MRDFKNLLSRPSHLDEQSEDERLNMREHYGFAQNLSHGVATVSLGRRFIGIESDLEHYQLAQTRLKASGADFREADTI